MLTIFTTLAMTALICLVIPSARLLGIAILVLLLIQFPIIFSGLAVLAGAAWFFLKR